MTTTHSRIEQQSNIQKTTTNKRDVKLWMDGALLILLIQTYGTLTLFYLVLMDIGIPTKRS